MKIKMRLYRQHDLDLIGLYINPNFSFRLVAKQALISYVRNVPFVIDAPKPVYPKRKISRIIQTTILVDDQDEDVTDWIIKTKPGYRNSLIKNVIRGYISSPNVFLYHDISNFSTDTATKKQKAPNVQREKVADKILHSPLNEISKETIHGADFKDSDMKHLQQHDSSPPEKNINDDRNKYGEIDILSGSKESSDFDFVNIADDMMKNMK